MRIDRRKKERPHGQRLTLLQNWGEGGRSEEEKKNKNKMKKKTRRLPIRLSSSKAPPPQKKLVPQHAVLQRESAALINQPSPPKREPPAPPPPAPPLSISRQLMWPTLLYSYAMLNVAEPTLVVSHYVNTFSLGAYIFYVLSPLSQLLGLLKGARWWR